MSKVIDFRVRPPYKSYLPFFTGNNPYTLSGQEAILGFINKLNFEEPESTKNADFNQFLKELDEAGIDIAVVTGRGMINVNNDDLIELAKTYPDRFVVFPFLSVVAPIEESIAAIDKYVLNDVAKGVAIEPSTERRKYDDEYFFPVFKYLEEHDIPVSITYNGGSDFTSPGQIEHIAIAFPNLKIILAHAGFPFVLENISNAFRHKNVYLLPDLYAQSGGPAEDLYVKAAKTLAQDNILYGSAYPLAPLKASLDHAKNHWGLTEEQANKVFYENAARILKLEE